MKHQTNLATTLQPTAQIPSDEEVFCALATEFGRFVNKTVCSRNEGTFVRDDFDELMARIFVGRHLLDGVTNDDEHPYNRLNVVRMILQESPTDPRAVWTRVKEKYGLGAIQSEDDS